MFKELSLENRVALITGAGRGIGKGIALALAEAGAHIVAAARTREEIEETAKEVRLLGREALAFPTDVTKPDQIEATVQKTLAHFGKIDILVNDAGTRIAKPVIPLPGRKPFRGEEWPGFYIPTTEEEWHRVLDTNLTSVFLCCRAVGPHFIERRRGKVVNISSMWGGKSIPDYTLYCTSKAAVNMLTRSLALEWIKFNIQVNAIAPGYILTPLVEKAYQDEELKKFILRAIPMGRTGEPREVGILAAYLASDASDYMTGQTIYIDGGILAQG